MKDNKRKYENENGDIFLSNKKQKLYDEKENIIKDLTEKIGKLEIKLKIKCNQIETLKYKLEYNSIPDYIS